MIKTSLCNLLGIEYPIMQGAMAHIANGHLAGSVSEAGGLGIIATGFADETFTREQIQIARSITSKPFGVNIILENPLAPKIAQVCAEEKVAVVTTGAGTPEPFMPVLVNAGIKVIPVIPHVRAAKKMEKLGAVAVVAEGLEGGGHIGKMTTLPLVRQVVEAVDIPVIAAGGIADGKGLMAALMLGAVGVQMGTVFLTAEECDVSDVYKQMIVDAVDTSTVLTGERGKKEVRCLKNPFTEKYWQLHRDGASSEELDQFCVGSLRRARDGDYEHGAFSAGQIAGLIKEVKPAKKIMKDIMDQADDAYAKFKKLYK